MTDYRTSSSVNWSTLRHILTSPRAYQHALAHPVEQTPAMAYGTLVHLHVLQPETVGDACALVPDEYVTASGTLSTAKGAREWLTTLPAGVTPITAGQALEMAAIVQAVEAHDGAAEWLATATQREQPIYWTDAATGIECKSLPDATGGGLLLDIKTWAPRGRFSADAFMRDALQRGYLGQLGYYASGLATLGRPVQRMGWIVIQSAAPWDVMVLELDVAAVDYAQREARSALDRLAEWRDEGCPDEGAAPGVTEVSLPLWMRRDADATADDVGF